MERALLDITAVVMQTTTFPADIAKLEEKCRSYPLIKNCKITIHQLTGQQVATDRFVLGLTGQFDIETKLLLKLKLDAVGSGELNTTTNVLRLTKVGIQNDFEGLLTKLAGMAGLVEGRELPVNPNAVAQLSGAMLNAYAQMAVA
jgi:hypothetical protein